MTFLEFKDKIGQEVYSVLEKEAEKEVSLALKMDLIDEYGAERYYHQRFLLLTKKSIYRGLVADHLVVIMDLRLIGQIKQR